MATIEIDGKQIEARDGSMVIEAADAAGIHIARFCYHKKLSVAANCRMCMVEVEKAPKPLPACATPVTDGMKVFTRSPLALDAQKGTMEFLLINHPLDCPICDQGGECDLQEMAMGYGEDVSKYHEGKRVVADKNIGPLIQTDMTRCIHCTRCVRFGTEVAGIRELGATGRGEHMEIGTFIEKSVDSEVSGNVIDLCPVGALTSKPFRYSARPWELTANASIAAHDAIGSNIYVQSTRNRVLRVLPRENEEINECWISDRDRFSYEAVNSEQRLTRPMLKSNDVWQEVEWSTALQAVADGLTKIQDSQGPARIGALISPNATLEEMYLCQKLLRAVGSDNIDHRLRQTDFRDDEGAPLFPSFGQEIGDLEHTDAALVIGSNIRKSLPLAALRLRKAGLAGARLMFLNPLDYEFNFPVYEKVVAGPAEWPAFLASLVKALAAASGRQLPGDCAALIKSVEPNDSSVAIAKTLHAATRATVLLGDLAQQHKDYSTLRALAAVVAELGGAKLGILPEAANSAGGWIAGAVPHRGASGKAVQGDGLNARQICEQRLSAYIVHGVDIEYDYRDPVEAQEAFADAQLTVFVSPFKTEFMERYGDVLLPCGPFTETSGTFVNGSGHWQSFAGSVAPLGEARPAWKIYRVLGNLLKLDGFEYVSSEEIRDEVRAAVGALASDNASGIRFPKQFSERASDGWQRIADVPLYAVDQLVRRAPSLQATVDRGVGAIHINSADASRLGVEAGDLIQAHYDQARAVSLPVAIDDRVPANCVYVPAALPETYVLGMRAADIKLQPLVQAEEASG